MFPSKFFLQIFLLIPNVIHATTKVETFPTLSNLIGNVSNCELQILRNHSAYQDFDPGGSFTIPIARLTQRAGKTLSSSKYRAFLDRLPAYKISLMFCHIPSSQDRIATREMFNWFNIAVQRALYVGKGHGSTEIISSMNVYILLVTSGDKLSSINEEMSIPTGYKSLDYFGIIVPLGGESLRVCVQPQGRRARISLMRCSPKGRDDIVKGVISLVAPPTTWREG